MRNQVQLGEPLRNHQWMIVGIVRGAGRPTRKLRALLEGGIAFAKQLRLRHAHLLQRGAQGRPGSLADPDDFDVGRFDQRDRKLARLHSPLVARRDDAGGEPPRGPTADDDDGAYLLDHDVGLRCYSLMRAPKV
jgi:hypothetical protein